MDTESKWQFNFISTLLTTILAMNGRINFTSLSRYSGLSDKTFRRWFKRFFDFCQFNSCAIDMVLPTEKEVVAVFDQSFQPKAGKKTYGRDFFWNSCASKAERGLEIGLCALIDVAAKVGYSVIADQTPHLDAIKRDDSDSRINFYLECIGKVRSILQKHTNYFAFDGYFSKKKMVDGIVNMGFFFIGKLRCDANLKILFTGKQKARGRRRKFAGKANISELEGFEREKDIEDIPTLYSGTFYHQFLERIIKVVAVRYLHNGKVGTALLFTTDLELSPFKIFCYYKSRFQIEFIFRDAKQYTGLSDCQSRNKESLHFHFNISLAALNLAKVQEQLEQQNAEQRRPFSMASYKAKYHNETMIEMIFSKLGFDLNLIKSSPIYEELLHFGTINY